MLFIRHIPTLLWKNFVIQRRQKLSTFLEIVLPMLFTIVLIWLRQGAFIEYYSEGRRYQDFSIDELPFSLIARETGRFTLLYSPKTALTKRIMERVRMKLLFAEEIGFNSEERMVEFFTGIRSNQTKAKIDLLAGVAFESELFNNSSFLPDSSITYKLRLPSEQRISRGKGRTIFAATEWYTELMFPSRRLVGPREAFTTYGGRPNYYQEGFLTLQRHIDASIASEYNVTSDLINDVILRLRRAPFPPWVSDPFIVVIKQQLPFLLLLTFLIATPTIVKNLVVEKETKMRELMKLMGLPSSANWLGWFIKCFTFLMASVLVMTILFFVDFGNGALIRNGEWSLYFVFMMFYTTSTITYCFAISVFFKSGNAGAAAGGILFLLSYMPNYFNRMNYETMNVASKVGLSVFHNVAMAFGCLHFGEREATGEGLNWSNVASGISVDDPFTMLHVILMLITDTLLYGLIAFYFDEVLDGGYGVPKPWYFLFTKWYWCGHSVKIESLDSSDEKQSGFIEQLTPGSPVSIRFDNLKKKFGKGDSLKVAVDGLSLCLVEGEITALLGQNGAGKTTTMSILTGFIPPTSGTAFVNSLDIREDMSRIRKTLGFCPQYNVLFDALTVKEHLMFFGKLKGCRGAALNREVSDLIEMLHLTDKANVLSNALSGGMKRKLCVGIALIGGSKIVILDEPTSGMDPEARRQMWDILQSNRKGRTMILSTHFMEEADYLGDRIAIMANGKLKCCGTSLFLKNKYGLGYNLSMVTSAAHDSAAISSCIEHHVPESFLRQKTNSEICFTLPQHCSAKFEALFDQLERQKTELGIQSFGVSVTTLEEVFIRINEEEQESHLNHTFTEDKKSFKQQPIVSEGNLESERTFKSSYKLATESTKGQTELGNRGGRLYLQQFRAMLYKRVLHSYRNSIVTALQVLVPLCFVLIGCIIVAVLPGPSEGVARPLELRGFGDDTTTVFSVRDSQKDESSDGMRLSESFRTFLTDNKFRVVKVNRSLGTNATADDYLYNYARTNLGTYIRNYMVAAEFLSINQTRFRGPAAVAIFNNEAYHSPAISLNVMSNTLLRRYSNTSERNSLRRRIRTVNHPLPRLSRTAIDERLLVENFIGVTLSYTVMFAVTFLVSGFLVFLVRERVTRSRHLQVVSGGSRLVYWSATLTWDAVCYLVVPLAMLACFAAFNTRAYSEGANAGVFMLVFILYGWSVLPFTYLISFMCTSPASGYVWTLVWNIFTGTAAIIAVSILLVLREDAIAEGLKWFFFTVFPNYVFGTALQDLYINYETKRICEDPTYGLDQLCPILELLNQTNPCCKASCGSNCAKYTDNILSFEEDALGRNLLFLFCQGVVFLLLIAVIESPNLKRFWQRLVAKTYSRSLQKHKKSNDVQLIGIDLTSTPDDHLGKGVDSDVHEEQLRVSTICSKTGTLRRELTGAIDTLILSNMSKYYGKFLAVDGLSFGVPAGECFGLLGVNGAGKTTTFKILTGDEMLTDGNAWIEGYSVKDEAEKLEHRVGYCPQFDALIDQMTVYETLEMYARIKGIQEHQIDEVIMSLIKSLLLGNYTYKQAGQLSGGNKRKLSTAIALIGSPPIVFLDEPTTGMDSLARRQLWKVLHEYRDSGKTIIFTSHSMEECEILCSRIAIMVNGRFQCLGSAQHLKSKFGDGYTLFVRVSSSALSNITQTFQEETRNSVRDKTTTDNSSQSFIQISDSKSIDEINSFSNNFTNKAFENFEYQNFTTLQSAKSATAHTSLSEQTIYTDKTNTKCNEGMISEEFRTQTLGTMNSEDGLRLRAELLDQLTNQLAEFVVSTFPGSVLKDRHRGYLHYQIRDQSVSWARLFGTMESVRERFHIEDYSVSQTSLEQVFLNFARDQRPTT